MSSVSGFFCRTLAFGVCIFVGASECDAQRDPGNPTASSAEPVVVRNGPKGAWKAGEAWRVVEQLRIGSVGGDASGPLFTNGLIGASLGPEGEIFILDFTADELTRVDGDGGNPRLVAREGEGPGELQVPAGMGWDDQQRLWIAGGRGRYTVFGASGKLLQTYPRPGIGSSRRQYPLVFEEAGTFIDEVPEAGGIRFLRMGADGEIVERLGRLSSEVADGLPPISPGQEAYRYALNHYQPRNRWAVTPHGTAWVVRTDKLQLYELDLRTGERLRVVQTVHRDGLKLSREDEKRIREGLAEAGLRRADVHLARPIVQSIHLTDDGFVLVQIAEEVGEDGNAFDVFSPVGQFLGTVIMPFRPPPQSGFTVDGDTLLGVAVTELDEPYVVRATIVRP